MVNKSNKELTLTAIFKYTTCASLTLEKWFCMLDLLDLPRAFAESTNPYDREDGSFMASELRKVVKADFELKAMIFCLAEDLASDTLIQALYDDWIIVRFLSTPVYPDFNDIRRIAKIFVHVK